MSEATFSVAGALPTPHRAWTAIARFFTAATATTAATASPRQRVDLPRRMDYVEHAAMSREMYRL